MKYHIQFIVSMITIQIVLVNSSHEPSDNVVKGFKLSGWICSKSVPQMCLKNKMINPMDFKTTVEICQSKTMWEDGYQEDGMSLFTMMVSKSELEKCNDVFKKFLLTQLVTDSFDQYNQKLSIDNNNINIMSDSLSKMNFDFSFSNVGKLGSLSASYDMIPSVGGVIGESICGNADLKSWSFSDVDCKLSTCGNIHVGINGDLNMKKDYSGDSTSMSISIGAITIGVSFSISDSKLVLSKPTIQLCWDVWSMNWFKMIKEFMSTSKIGVTLQKILLTLIKIKDEVSAMRTMVDQKNKIMEVLKLLNAGANVCKAKFYKPKDLIIERSNNILNAGDSLKNTVLELLELAVKTIKSNVSLNKHKKNNKILSPLLAI